MSVQVKGSGTIGGLDEGLNVVGVVTSTSFVGTGVSVVGVVTATSFSGSGANLTGITIPSGSTGLDLNDNIKIRLGTGNDLEIFHNGSSSVIRDGGSGALTIQNVNSEVNIFNTTDSEYLAQFINGGACKLYNDGTKKFETTNTGAVVTGICTATSFSGSGANLTSLPAANLTGTLPAISGANLTNISGIVTEVDSWRLTTNFTQPGSHGQYITANWARKSSSLNFAKKGTGITESSGIFTFPSTGLWLITIQLSGNTNGNSLVYWGPYIQISSDSGSNFSRRSETYGHMEHGTRYQTIMGQALVSVTNASTFRVRIETECNASLNIRASNNMSNLDFIRLGDV